jgi:hypothetical protein
MTNTDDKIAIQYGVRSADAGGWLPVMVRNGKEHWSWRRTGYAQGTALAMAYADARDEASRYSGDWNVSVEMIAGVVA